MLPGEPSDHMEALLKVLLSAAHREVDRAGGFLPFGASMAPDGEVELLDAGGTGRNKERTQEEQLLALRASARAGRDRLLAVGVCLDVALARGAYPEAIRVDLEHRDADPVTWLQPYRNTDDELTWGERVPMPGERRTWDGPT